MGDPNEPSLWLILILGLALMGAFILLLWGVHRLAGRPKSEGEEHAPAVASRPIAEEAETAVRPPLISELMSMFLGAAGPIDVAATPLPAHPQEAGQGVAKPGNAVNAELPGNLLPEEVREILRFWAKVEAAEAIIAGGKVGQTEAIETVFGCKRSGRPESVYGRAVAAIRARSEAAYRERQARLVELQAAAVAGQEE
jgi:hypothetical protein